MRPTAAAATSSPTIEPPQVLSGVWSPQRRNRRDVHVYLPPSYGDGRRRYPVIYMQDGQNLADHRTAFSGIWELHQTIDRLHAAGIETIIVGIPNMREDRANEYSPFRDRRLGGGHGDAYLAFIVDTLKPLVDRQFRTRAERDFTTIFGSSMGGLISLHAFFRYPEVFGRAGAMSPSLWFAQGAIFESIRSAPFVRGRLYLDVGTGEGVLALGDVRQMRTLLVKKKYRPGKAFLYVEDEGAVHNEVAWARRLPNALSFLLSGRPLPTKSRRRQRR